MTKKSRSEPIGDELHTEKPERPRRWSEEAVPPVPSVDRSKPGVAAAELSRFNTNLSTRRTSLSEHRTSLSEYRTDLSTRRTEMSRRRTGLSFQRTRMSADRTLMAVTRTSLALITFGFTISEVFQKLREQGIVSDVARAQGFGFALFGLGLAMLAGGIVYHLWFMYGLRAVRRRMTADGMIHGESVFPPSLPLISAVLLLLIGVVAIVTMLLHIGPFG